MKKLLSLKGIFFLFTVTMLLSAFSSLSYAADLSSIDFQEIGNSYAILKCDTKASGKLDIPQTVNGKTVVSIAENAFYSCENLTEINLPETVVSIGANAFSMCTSLESFDMPDSVENLGKSVFSKCHSLKSVSLSQSLSFIPEATFYMCSALEYVDFPDNITLISRKAFSDCSSLTKLSLPERVAEISANCFSDCKNLKSIYLPSSLEVIDSSAFEKCTSLTYIYYQGSYNNFQGINILSGNSALAPGYIIYNHDHKKASDKSVVTASCTVSGYTEYNCPCGIVFKDDYIMAGGHNLTEFITINDSDCVNTGLAYLKCSKCSFYEEIILTVKKHTPVTDEAVASTCVKTGLTKGSHCSECNQVIVAQKTVPLASHTYTKKITDKNHLAVAGTYTTPAKYYYSCKVCNAVSKKDTFSGSTLVLGKTSKFTSSSTQNSITLSWNKVKDATGYTVYYKNGSGKWKAYKKVTTNSLKISNLPAGKAYEFALRAYVVEKKVTVDAPAYVIHKAATKPVAPNKITAKQNETAIQLNWNASSGATHYQVYYYNTSGKKWVLLKNDVKGCKYTISSLKTGVAYKFAVRPCINTGDVNVIGSSYITISTSTKAKAPTLKSTPLKGGVRFNWSKVSGADGYIIYGSTKPNSGYSRLTTTTALTYTKSGLASGKTYYFKAYSYKNTPSGVVYSYAGTVKAVTTK